MWQLFLGGGGNELQSAPLDRAFAQHIDKSRPLLYIPVAMDPQQISYERCLEWISGVFEPLGISDITMWVDLHNKTLEDVNGFSAVYIGGGNTFSLLANLWTSGFGKIVQQYVAEGGVVYGGSAGAIVLGADIRTCAHMDANNVGVRNYSGLNLLNGYSVWCHYTESDDSLINEYIMEYTYPVMALAEEAGVRVSCGRFEAVGSTPVYVFKQDMQGRISKQVLA